MHGFDVTEVVADCGEVLVRGACSGEVFGVGRFGGLSATV